MRHLFFSTLRSPGSDSSFEASAYSFPLQLLYFFWGSLPLPNLPFTASGIVSCHSEHAPLLCLLNTPLFWQHLQLSLQYGPWSLVSGNWTQGPWGVEWGNGAPQKGLESRCTRSKHIKDFAAVPGIGRVATYLDMGLPRVIIFRWQMRQCCWGRNHRTRVRCMLPYRVS